MCESYKRSQEFLETLQTGIAHEDVDVGFRRNLLELISYKAETIDREWFIGPSKSEFL